MNKLENPRVRSRKLWDKHGSWLILVVVFGLAWNGGGEWKSYQCRQVITKMIDSSVAERDDLRGRLRETNRLNRELSAQLGPSAVKAAEAAAKAAEAAESATKAVEKASSAVEKADQLLEQTK